MPRLLVLFAHPALEKSRVHRRMLHHLRSVDGVTINDLYEQYPDFDVDVAREQALLTAHDVVLVQHPIYWYSAPALVKQWEDLVLQHGWAYGTGGTHLHGKYFGCALTTGGRAAAYRREGYNRFTMRELLAPLEQTAALCGMRWLPPYLIQGTHLLDAPAIESHARAYAEFIAAVVDGTLSLESAGSLERLNDALPPSSTGPTGQGASHVG